MAVFLIVASSVMAQNGQQLTSVTRHYKPGDTLRYVVTFDGDPNLDSVNIYLASQAVNPDQSGLSNGFNIGRSKKIGPGTFEVEGEVPGNAASGTYQLSSVNVRIGQFGAKGYDARQFRESILLDNSSKYEFPALKSVAPQ